MSAWLYFAPQGPFFDSIAKGDRSSKGGGKRREQPRRKRSRLWNNVMEDLYSATAETENENKAPHWNDLSNSIDAQDGIEKLYDSVAWMAKLKSPRTKLGSPG